MKERCKAGYMLLLHDLLHDLPCFGLCQERGGYDVKGG